MMNIKIRVLTAGILLVGCISLNAQQIPVFSQYSVNKFLLNPAVAGGNKYSFVNLIAREQFHGFENAPRTFALNAQTRLLNDSYIMRRLQVKNNSNRKSTMANIGLGANIFSDRNGRISKTGLQLTYAYHLNFDNNFQMSMGISGAAFQYKLDDNDAYLVDPSDPILLSNDKQFWVPDATIGIYLTDSRMYAGAAMSDLFGSSLKLGSDLMDNFRTARNYNFMAGYRYALQSGFLLEPSVLVRLNKYNNLVDINAKLFYQNAYWLGFAYRTDKTLITMVGLNVDIFYFGYAYDASFGPVKTYTSGSHELMLGLRFGDNSTRRFRWLKKDDVEFEM